MSKVISYIQLMDFKTKKLNKEIIHTLKDTDEIIRDTIMHLCESLINSTSIKDIEFYMEEIHDAMENLYNNQTKLYNKLRKEHI